MRSPDALGVFLFVVCLVREGSPLQVTGSSQQDSECAACNVIAGELQHQTGGVPMYSELKRMEVLETVCGNLEDYMGSAQDGKTRFKKPKRGKDGKPVGL